MRLLMEVLGWIVTIIGAYFVFGDNPLVIHYIILGLGIVVILLTLPKTFRNRRK